MLKNKKITNLPLGRKIVLIILLVILLVTGFSSAGIIMSLRASNELLYQALAGSLTYSADDISRKLSNIESMTSAIVSNSNIRKNLITLTDDDSEIRTANAESSLATLIADYYQTYKDNNISYINLYHAKGETLSYETKSSLVPEAIHQEVITAAGNNSGYPHWMTGYSNSYGLFLGRSSRRVEQLNFNTLGTVVVCVDMDRLVRSSTNAILHSGETQYALFQDNHEFYHSDRISSAEFQLINQHLNNDYDIITVDSGQYFAVRGAIENTPWSYICLIPYEPIARTLNLTKLLAMIVIVFAVILSLLLSQLLIRSVTRDFSRLVNKMKAFGKDEAKLPGIGYDYSSRQDEIGILHNQFDQMALKIQNLIQENYVHEILSKDARLKALENQINPHFLYNTLETVNWRAKAIGEKDISAMVEALGTLLRETLTATDKLFTIRRELETVRNYLTIQQIRFCDRLEYSEDIEAAVLDANVPHFSIQPLVENAIHYAMEKSTEKCHIRIEGRCSDDIIYIDVINNDSQFEPDLLDKLKQGLVTPHGFGIGLLNIHKRIQLICGTEFGLVLFNRDENHAVARITIPGGTDVKTIDRR